MFGVGLFGNLWKDDVSVYCKYEMSCLGDLYSLFTRAHIL